jgi:glycosyltransferase involved in cell wall biosynthesis
MHEVVHYSFVPASAWVAGRLDERMIVYHAADEYSAFAGADPGAVTRLEGELLRRADLYIACSSPLLDKGARARRAVLVRHGVEHGHFARALDASTPIPDALASAKRPVVGFIGLIAEWVDLGLLARVADRLDGTLVVVGGVRGADAAALASLASRRNVILPGRRPYDELPGWCRGFDVAVLPFSVSDLTINANPLKLREYLAAGLPVVSTDIPEARALAERAPGGVTVATSDEEFVNATLAHAHAADAGPRRERSGTVADEDWDAKVAAIRSALRSIPEVPRA